ncbi:MAG: type II toxin-antitoxin system RelE/ParE family toxin [Prolixibacteraceae bacterium]|nr:type II toxin-antitoxin system RelE/ParE family toxin [Prolixibacteraceae bacterium]
MVMKKSRVIIAHKARASLRGYVQYLKREVSEETAEHVRIGILDKCKSLKDFSGYSKERYLEDEPGVYRSATKWDYNIIYTVVKNEVRVLNIIHTSRHPSKRKDI